MMLPMVGTDVFFLGFGSSTGTSIQCYCRKPRTHAPLRDVLLVRNYKRERGWCIYVFLYIFLPRFEFGTRHGMDRIWKKRFYV